MQSTNNKLLSRFWSPKVGVMVVGLVAVICALMGMHMNHTSAKRTGVYPSSDQARQISPRSSVQGGGSVSGTHGTGIAKDGWIELKAPTVPVIWLPNDPVHFYAADLREIGVFGKDGVFYPSEGHTVEEALEMALSTMHESSASQCQREIDQFADLCKIDPMINGCDTRKPYDCNQGWHQKKPEAQ